MAGRGPPYNPGENLGGAVELDGGPGPAVRGSALGGIADPLSASFRLAKRGA